MVCVVGKMSKDIGMTIRKVLRCRSYSIHRDGSKENGCPIEFIQSDMFKGVFSHKLLWTIPVILKCFHQYPDC